MPTNGSMDEWIKKKLNVYNIHIYIHAHIHIHTYTYEGDKQLEFIIKIVYLFIFTCLNFSHSALDAIHLLRYFFHCSKQLLNSSVLMPFSALAIIYFTSSTSAKYFPLRTFFIWGNKKRGGKIGRTGRVGHGGHAVFGQKLLNTQRGLAGVLEDRPS